MTPIQPRRSHPWTRSTRGMTRSGERREINAPWGPVHRHEPREAPDPCIVVRTGKRLSSKFTESAICFKPTPHLMFPIDMSGQLQKNILTFRLQPNGGLAPEVQGEDHGT